MLRSYRFLRSQSLFAAACFCLSLIFADRAAAQSPLYHFTNLGALPGYTFSVAHGINAFGQAVGISYNSSGNDEAFLWTPSSPNGSSGTMVDLGVLPGDTSSEAYGIDDFGQVVGYSASSTGSKHAFLWTPSSPNGSSGTMVDLGTLPGFTSGSFAAAINAAGQVVGYSSASGGALHAFLWTPSSPNGSSGTMVDLGVLAGGTSSTATGINASGQVVGNSFVSGVPHAFLWTPSSPNGSSGTMLDLGILPGYTFSAALGINASGQVVGYSASSTGSKHAYLWTPSSPNGSSGTMRDLGTLPGFTSGSFAAAINAAGQVIGESDNPNAPPPGSHAFLRQNGTLLDLNHLISAGSGATLAGAGGINPSGQIVGGYSSAGSHLAYLLTPIGHILPDHGGNNGDVSVTIVYPGLQSGATVSLTAGAHTFVGDQVSVVDDPNFPVQVLRATFHLNTAAPGAYNVVLNIPGIPKITLQKAFTVQKSGAPQIALSFLGLSQSRAGYPSTYQILLTNQGNLDAIDVPVWVAGLPPGTAITLTYQSPPPLSGIDVSGFNLWVTLTPQNPTQLMLPVLVPLVPAGATVSLQFQLTYPVPPLSGGANLLAWTTPLYDLMSPSGGTSLLAADFQQIIGEIYQQANNGTPADPASLSSATQTLLSQLLSLANAAYQDQSAPQPPTAFTQLIAQAVKLTAQKTGVTLSDAAIQHQLDIVNYSDFASLVTQAQVSLSVAIIDSIDPNQVTGPLGWVAGSKPILYSAECGNASNASASAMHVLIVAHLNPAVLDLTTLSLGDMLVVDQTLTPTPDIVPIQGQQEFNDIGLPVGQVDVNANANLNLSVDSYNTNQLAWNFDTTNTNGFLAPGKNIQVSFTIRPKVGLPTGTSIGNMSVDIKFDKNGKLSRNWPPANYPPAQIDFDVPTSAVHSLPAITTNPSIPVKWQWSKPAGGSEMQQVSVYVSDNSSGFVPWQTTTNPPLTGTASATYPGVVGHTYSFYSLARDNAGNLQPIPATYPTITIVLGPYLLSFSPNPVLGGTSSQGTVKINVPAPSGGAVVKLISWNPMVASVPSSVTIAAGATSASFPITTHPVSVLTTVPITATYNANNLSAMLSVRPPIPSALSFNPNPVVGGASSQGTVTLEGATLVNTTVALTSSNTAVATVPESVTVPAGSTSAKFNITTFKVSATKSVTITAKANGGSKKATLTVTP